MNDEKKVDVSNDSLFGTLKTKCENQFTDLSNFVGVYNTSKNDIAEDFIRLLTADKTLPFILNVCSTFSDPNKHIYRCEIPEYDEIYEFANIFQKIYGGIPISNVNSKRTFDYIDLRGRKNKNFSEYCSFDLSFDYDPIKKTRIRNALNVLDKAQLIENMPHKRFILNGCVPYNEVENQNEDVVNEPLGNSRTLLDNIVAYFSIKYYCIMNFLTSLESVCHDDHNLADIRDIQFYIAKWYKTDNAHICAGGVVSTILLDLTSIINSRLPDGIGVVIKLVGKPDGKSKIDYSKERVGLHISLLVKKELCDDNSASFIKMIDDYHARIQIPKFDEVKEKDEKSLYPSIINQGKKD